MLKKRSSGLILSYLNAFLNIACGLYLSSFLLRQLGDVEYGLYQTINSFAGYLVLLEFGTGTVLARNISACRAKGADKEEIERNIATIWGITNLLTLVIIAFAVVFYFAIGEIYSNTLTPDQIVDSRKMFVFMIVFMIASFFSQTLNGIALSHEHYTFSSTVSVVKMVSRTLLLTVTILNWRSGIVIAAVDMVISATIAIYTYVFCQKSFGVRIGLRGFDKQILKASLPLCIAMFLQVIINQANSLVGKFVLGVMSGPRDVSLYSVSVYLFNMLSSLSTIPVSLYVPQVTRDVMSGLEGRKLTDSIISPCRLIVLASGTILFGFIACGKQFISIMYGEHYLLSWFMALILMVPMFINMSNALVLNILDAKNKRIVRSYILMITTALNVLMTIFGIKYFGIVAAAVATGFSTMIQVVIMNVYYQKAIGLHIMYLFKNILRGLVPAQIIGAIVGYLAGMVIENVYISFLISGGLFVVVSVGCYWMFGFNSSEKARAKSLISKFTRGKIS